MRRRRGLRPPPTMPDEPADAAPTPAAAPAAEAEPVRQAVTPRSGRLTERTLLRRLAPVLVVLVSLLVYGNALQNGFVLDDGPVVLRNPLVHSVDGLWRAFTEPYWPPPSAGGQYRPLGTISFAVDWAVSGGDPRWLHAANILWHAAAALLVWFLALELLAPAAALVTALLFAVHPVHVEAVANLVGRLEPIAAVFVLGALLAHRRRSWWAVALFALALLAKESAMVFLGLVVAHDLLLSGEWRAALRRSRGRYAAYGATVAAYAAVLVAVFHDRSFTIPAPTFLGATTGERLLTVATIVPHYVRLLFVPVHLSGDYYPQVIGLATGVTPAGLFGLALAIALGVAVRRAWRPVPELAFALVWIPIAIAPVSNVFFPSVALAERTLYLASVGSCLALGVLAQRLARERTEMVAVLAALVITLGAVRVWTRTPVWRSDKTYLLALLRDHPESYRAHLVAGRVLASQGQDDAAAEHFEEASRLFGRDAGGAFEAAGAAARLGRLDRADSLLTVAHAAAPDRAEVLLARGEIGLARGANSAALRDGRAAVALAPDSTSGWVIVSAAARRLGDLAAAESALRRAIALDPAQWQLRMGFADLLLERGNAGEARVQADSAVLISRGALPAVEFRDRALRRRPGNDSIPSGPLGS